MEDFKTVVVKLTQRKNHFHVNNLIRWIALETGEI